MASILVGSREYRLRPSGGYSEADFEKLVYSHRETLFPAEHLVYFKADVRWGDDVRRADFALVDKRYKYWVVVEIELAHHDFVGHVFPQVETLRNGEYGERHAEAILSEKRDLDRNKLENLIVGSTPQVWVIADRPVERWKAPLEALRVLLSSIEVYESGQASIALRFAGTRPSSEVRSVGVLTNLMGRVWKVENFPGIRSHLGSDVAISFGDEEWEWTVKVLGGHLTIVSAGETIPLDTSRKYFLTEFENGSLSLVTKKPGKKVDINEI